MKNLVRIIALTAVIGFGIIACGGQTSYTVTFNSNGGSSVAKITGVSNGAKITEPTAPTRSEFTFDGWYKETGLINIWNFASDIVTSNITLYAKWTSSEPELTEASTVDIVLPEKFTGSVSIEFPAGLTKEQRDDAENKFKQVWSVGVGTLGDMPPGLYLDSLNVVLARGLKIVVDNSGTPYNGYKIIDWKTVSCHISYISVASVKAISDNLDSAMLNGMHHLTE